MSTALLNRRPPGLGLLTGIAVVAGLYFGQGFLCPLVLAALLSFLLSPVNRWLERHRFGRISAVLATTTASFLLIGGVIYLVSVQVVDLVSALPQYKDNLIAKANSLRVDSSGPVAKAIQTFQEIVATTKTDAHPISPGIVTPPPKEAPVRVEVAPSTSELFGAMTHMLGPILSPIGEAFVVLIMAIFMMLSRDDLRDRLVYLVGRGKLRVNTQAFDEAAERVSGYLAAQLLVNISYGLPIGLGLYWIGIPNAVLWGVLAIVFRFLPYIGPWIGAAFPILLAIAVSTTWSALVITIALFVVMELLISNFIEPWLYGARTGLSPLAVVVSAIFWTWLWGFAGLVLATPLTVCLVVLGRHLPQLRFLELLLSDRPPITTADRLYHRLLASDPDEGQVLFEAAIEESSFIAVCDTVALPALYQIESDFQDGLLTETKRAGALGSLREVVTETSAASELPPVVPHSTILCIPANHLADQTASDIFVEALRHRGLVAEPVSSGLTSGEIVTRIVTENPGLVCLSTVPPASIVAAAFICKQVRAQLPDLRIFVGLWQPEDAEFARRSKRLTDSGAQRVLSTIERLVAAVHEAVPTLAPPAENQKEPPAA